MAVLVPDRLTAQGQALLYGVSSGVGGVLGAALAGVARKLGGSEACFTFGAIVAAVGFALALRLRAPDADPTPDNASPAQA